MKWIKPVLKHLEGEEFVAGIWRWRDAGIAETVDEILCSKSSRNILDIPMLMERTPDAIGEAMREMLRGLKQVSVEVLSDDPVSFFVNEVIQIALDWMGSRGLEQIDELLCHIRIALNDEAEDIYCLDSLSPNNQLTVALQGFGQFMAVFLAKSKFDVKSWAAYGGFSESDVEVINYPEPQGELSTCLHKGRCVVL